MNYIRGRRVKLINLFGDVKIYNFSKELLATEKDNIDFYMSNVKLRDNGSITGTYLGISNRNLESGLKTVKLSEKGVYFKINNAYVKELSMMSVSNREGELRVTGML